MIYFLHWQKAMSLLIRGISIEWNQFTTGTTCFVNSQNKVKQNLNTQCLAPFHFTQFTTILLLQLLLHFNIYFSMHEKIIWNLLRLIFCGQMLFLLPAITSFPTSYFFPNSQTCFGRRLEVKNITSPIVTLIYNNSMISKQEDTMHIHTHRQPNTHIIYMKKTMGFFQFPTSKSIHKYCLPEAIIEDTQGSIEED